MSCFYYSIFTTSLIAMARAFSGIPCRNVLCEFALIYCLRFISKDVVLRNASSAPQRFCGGGWIYRVILIWIRVYAWKYNPKIPFYTNPSLPRVWFEPVLVRRQMSAREVAKRSQFVDALEAERQTNVILITVFVSVLILCILFFIPLFSGVIQFCNTV